MPSQRNTEISSVFFGAELGLEDQVELAALAKQLEEVYPPGARTGPQGAAGQGAGGRQRRPLGPAGGADGAVVAARTGGAGHRGGDRWTCSIVQWIVAVFPDPVMPWRAW